MNKRKKPEAAEIKKLTDALQAIKIKDIFIHRKNTIQSNKKDNKHIGV